MRFAYLLALALTLIHFGSLSSAQEKNAVKKSTTKIYKLTEKEKKIVKDAKAAFKRAEKAPPPSEHMQKKMQSGVGE